MVVKRYSHSKLSSFEQCNLKYKFRYIDKIIIIEKTIEAFLGKSVHETLEWLYTNLVQNNPTPSIEQVIDYFSNIWKEKYTFDTKINKPELTQEDYFSLGVQFLLNYYQTNYPFKDKTIAIEKKITIDLDEIEGTQIEGYIDRLVHNELENKYEIHDYKTSGSLPSKEKIDSDRQLALYSIAIKNEFGHDKEVKLVWHFLAFNKKIEIIKTKEEIDKLKKEIVDTIKEIESTKRFIPTRSRLCDWCEYKSICPAWDDTVTEEEFEDIMNIKEE